MCIQLRKVLQFRHVIFLHKLKGQIMQYWTEIVSFIVGLAGGWTLKMMFDNSKNTTTIKGVKTRGDIAGRDIHKK